MVTQFPSVVKTFDCRTHGFIVFCISWHIFENILGMFPGSFLFYHVNFPKIELYEGKLGKLCPDALCPEQTAFFQCLNFCLKFLI